MKKSGKRKIAAGMAGAVAAVAGLVALHQTSALAQYSASRVPTSILPGWAISDGDAQRGNVAPPRALNAVIQSLGRSFRGQVGIAVQSVDAGMDHRL